MSWRSNAELVSDGDPRILGEDYRGELWVPALCENGKWWWAERFNPWNPRHWIYYLRSRRQGRIAFLIEEPTS